MGTAIQEMKSKLWGGRFKKRIDPDFEVFSSSLQSDRWLLPYDLKIDAAHVKALKKCGVLSGLETKKFLSAIAEIESRYRQGKLKLNEQAEDVHSAVQSLLESRLGKLADKLHTARSRNDLVSQSTRLYCRDNAERIYSLLTKLQIEWVHKSEEYSDVYVPGMTHMQNAQVLSQAHIFLAYAEMLKRAKARFEGGRQFFDVCVLGSGALAGVSFGLDQELMARELGLRHITDNSYDVSGDRDFVFNFLSCVFFTGLEISRISEDLMIGQMKGVSLVDIDQAFCTGSSMMPQKKNADFAELARGAAAVFGANFTGMGLILKGLPTSYNRDLQWDKKFLFDSAERCQALLALFIKMVHGLKINRARAAELLKDESLYATDLADYLVRHGVPFKTAHDQVGQLISFAEESGVSLSKIGLDIYRRFAPKTQGDVYDLFDAEHSARLKKTRGSTHPDEVKKQILRWKKDLRRA
jgi:argininosuccinate lyase